MHLISSLEAGGAQTMLGRLVAASDRSRFRHRVVTMIDGGSQADKVLAAGIPVESLGMRRGVPSAAAACRFARVVGRERPHVLQTWLYHADLLGLLVAAPTRTAVVWNIRSSFHFGLDSAVTRWCARLSRFPAAIVVNSEAGRRIHTALGYRPRQWRLIGNGFDLDLFQPSPEARASVRRELGVGETAPLVGLVARFDPLKDHATFLDAARRLAATCDAVRFVLVGEGTAADNTTLAALVDRTGAGGRLFRLGERADVPRLTAAFDVASCTSTGEGFPNVVGEAMACAVPCVVTDVGDAAAIVGDSGVVVPAGDPAALAEGWAGLLRMSAESRQALGAAARRRIAEKFSIGAIVREYEDLYEAVAARAA